MFFLGQPLLRPAGHEMRNVAYLARAYLAIRRSGRFDSAHYIGQLGRIGHRRFVPLIHYLWSGERKGREPFPGFKPKLYRMFNEELIDGGVSPLHHFVLRQGRPAGSPEAARPELAASIAAMVQQSPVAVVCHIFYHSIVDEMVALIAGLDVSADLIFTLTDREGSGEIAARLAKRWPRAAVLRFPNRGRDILPFVTLINSGKLDGYAAVLKLHTKRSLHRRDGDTWRRRVMEPLFHAPRAIIEWFERGPASGLVAADGAFLVGDRHWGPNLARGRELAARLGIDVDRITLGFPAGSMYWISPVILREIGHLDLDSADFEAELGQLDGTTAHAIERLIGVIGEAKRLRMVEVRDVLG